MHQKWLKRAQLRMAMGTQVAASGTGRAAEPEEVQVWGKRTGCEHGARAREALPGWGALDFGA